MITVENKQYKRTELNTSKIIENTRFVNCVFEKCKLSDYRFTNCEFEDCIFTNCDFTKSFLAFNRNYKSGKFIKCLFITCNLTATSFRFPIIDECEFRNCILFETNFDGSRFSNTKFIGELDSCFFRGYSVYAEGSSLFSFSRFDASQIRNKMTDVDFSSSKMVGVFFTNSIDLSNCKFPIGDDYIYISDLGKTINKVVEVIKNQWNDGYEKETGLKLVNNVYYNKDKKEQNNDFIDSFLVKEIGNEEGDEGVGMKVFNLIRSLQ